MNKKNILTHALAFIVLTLPVIARAHGGVDDGDGGAVTVDADGHHAGASELLLPWSARWWGIMAVSLILMSSLCYGVYRYIQVPPVKPMKPILPEEKPSEKK